MSFHRSCSRASADLVVSSFTYELLCFYCTTLTTRITAQRDTGGGINVHIPRRHEVLVRAGRHLCDDSATRTSNIWTDKTALKLRRKESEYYVHCL